MLEELHVEGYAIIDRVDVRFAPGLNVLSGETGAGKSILVGALGLLLGDKGDATAVRAGREEAAVAGVVRVEGNPGAAEWLSRKAIAQEDGAVILRRTLRANGRGQFYIQATPVARADVQELTAMLFDMHGQHEHQSLLRVETHRELIDRFGGFSDEVVAFGREFHELADRRKEYQALLDDERNQVREKDMLAFAVREIEQCGLKEGEEDELLRETKILAQSEKLYSLLDDFHRSCAESRVGALASLRQGLGDLREMGRIDPGLAEHAGRLESLFYELEDIVEVVRVYQSSVDFSPRRLEECEERLALVRRLEKKYGNTVRDVLLYAADARKRLDRMENLDSEREKLKADIAAREKSVWAGARRLSEKRRAAAEELQRRIQANLVVLGMPKAVFRIQIGARESENGKPVCGPHGIDRPEFLISPNQGEPPRALRSTASGGEMSRVMLAIKSVLSENDEIQSLIFDEIDAGIGGEVAIAVGDHLSRLSRHKQVLCITHLATIAAKADNHLKVEKLAEGERTVTKVAAVVGVDRIAEIARMLAGDSTGSASLTHAEELLRKAGRK